MARLATALKIIVMASACLLVSSCDRGPGPDADASIDFDKPFLTLHGLTIENGSAFDQATVDLEKYKKVILPDKAEVRREGEGSKLQIFMRKTLAYGGHPTEPLSIRAGRKYMGCASRPEGDALVVATFGEWDSRIEGGAYMRLVFVVPAGVEVEKRSGLSGPKSAVLERHGEKFTTRKEDLEGYWYGQAARAEGWAVIPGVPDPKKRAKD